MGFVALVGVALLIGIPISAIVALVRSGSVARDLAESKARIEALDGEIDELRRQLSKLTARVGDLAAAPVRTGEAQPARKPLAHPVPQPSPEPQIQVPLAAQPAAPESAVTEVFAEPLASAARHAVPSVAAALHALDVELETPPEPQPVAVSLPPVADSEQPAAAPIPAAPLPPQFPAPPRFAAFDPGPPRIPWTERLKSTLPLEQLLGMNLFAKIGIVLLVLGFALLGRIALISMGPAARAALIYAAGAVLLGGGIRLESRERYRLVGRTGIGGGWALLFFTTYAMHHVAPMMVLASTTLDCILMLLVAAAMVAHTLRYRSQLVTGLAFLLAFSTVALSQDSVYALSAGVILALGIVAIALRMRWYELEIFGILASYANHFYWLYRLYPDGFGGRTFPQFWPSALILVLYWLIFRISYVVRPIDSRRQEVLSTVAALSNALLLLVVMKFQSTHPELAFYALLGLGALEFFFGQLPATRRRRAAFVLLTVLGTLLIYVAIPFKYSGNSVALFWMVAAEALLVAGIAQRERLFRMLGWIAGVLTGLLIVYESLGLLELRRASEAVQLSSGILLVTASLLFYLNALVLGRRWQALFNEIEEQLAFSHGHLGAFTAFFGVWSLVTGDWTAIGWAVLFVAAVVGAQRLENNHLLAQAWLLAAAAALRAGFFNCHFYDGYPHHLPMRLLTLPLLAALFYLGAWRLRAKADTTLPLRALSLWTAAASLAALAWLELPQPWVAPAWTALAVVLCLIGRRLGLAEFAFQEHLLIAGAAVQLAAVNLFTATPVERYLPLVCCAAAFYAISRFATLKEAIYRRPAAWAHTWAATALLAALAWHETSQPWLAVLWALFALVLALVDRFRTVEELPAQAHVLAALTVAQTAAVNLFLTGKWHAVSLRLLTTVIVIASLYAIALWVRMPRRYSKSELRHIYSWIAAALAAWLLWLELAPVGVALGLGLYGVVLFELGLWRAGRQFRLQAYALFTASFLRIFFVNLTAPTLPGEWLSPRIYTVVPLALIYFYVWVRLQSGEAGPGIVRSAAEKLVVYFGSGSIVALLYYQIASEWIIVAWAAAAVVLLVAALVLERNVFLEQTVLLTAGILVRGLAYNIFGASYFTESGWCGRFSVPALTAALLLGALPVAFRIRRRLAGPGVRSRILRWLGADHPQQALFFAPVLLIVFTIAVKMNPGLVTLSWGITGVGAILLGLLVGERSYRLTGLALLLLCVGKIVFHDAWQLDERDRYITFIVLGAALTMVSALYSKFRDQLNRLL